MPYIELVFLSFFRNEYVFYQGRYFYSRNEKEEEKKNLRPNPKALCDIKEGTANIFFLTNGKDCELPTSELK